MTNVDITYIHSYLLLVLPASIMSPVCVVHEFYQINTKNTHTYCARRSVLLPANKLAS